MIDRSEIMSQNQDIDVLIQNTMSPLDSEEKSHEDISLEEGVGAKIVVEPTSPLSSKKLMINTSRTCECRLNNLNCLTPKEWIKCQLGVWEFNYEKRDIRDKSKHPATFPLSLARRCIELFSHQGELVVDPFMGSGTSLLAARDASRNAVGFDINSDYIALAQSRLNQEDLFTHTTQISVLDDARHMAHYLNEESISCIVTSPPYANLLNRQRHNKSRRGIERKNDQYKKVEQYSQNAEDLGILSLEKYSIAMAEIFEGILPLMKKKGHVVINVPDMWWENERITIHVSVIEAMRSVGYELRNTIIWNRLNIVNNVGIFGWPSNYITMGTTFEYILDFWRPDKASLVVDKDIIDKQIAEDLSVKPDDEEAFANLPEMEASKVIPSVSKTNNKTKGSGKRAKTKKREVAENMPLLDSIEVMPDKEP